MVKLVYGGMELNRFLKIVVDYCSVMSLLFQFVVEKQVFLRSDIKIDNTTGAVYLHKIKKKNNIKMYKK